MKIKIYLLLFILIGSCTIQAQEVKNNKDRKVDKKITGTKIINATASTGDSIIF